MWRKSADFIHSFIVNLLLPLCHVHDPVSQNASFPAQPVHDALPGNLPIPPSHAQNPEKKKNAYLLLWWREAGVGVPRAVSTSSSKPSEPSSSVATLRRAWVKFVGLGSLSASGSASSRGDGGLLSAAAWSNSWSSSIGTSVFIVLPAGGMPKTSSSSGADDLSISQFVGFSSEAL